MKLAPHPFHPARPVAGQVVSGRRPLRVSLVLLAALAAPGAARADDVADVKAVLDRFDKAYEAKDADGIAALVARDPDVVFYSADVGDRWVGAAAIRVGFGIDFKRMKSVTIEPQPATVHVRGGTIAWFERVLVMNLEVREGEMSLFSRWTGVLEKQNGKWLFVQSHLSVGAPRESVPKD